MRRVLALALLASAALPLGSAHASSSDCLEPLLTQSAPRFVYYDPEIGGYYVDVTAAQEWIGGQPGRATAVADCLATLPSSARGCVTQFLLGKFPGGEPEFVLAVADRSVDLVLCIA